MTSQKIEKLWKDAMSALDDLNFKETIILLTEFISLENNHDNLKGAYNIRGYAYRETYQNEKAAADWKKAADYGDEMALNDLKEMGINYTPQEPSLSGSSSAPDVNVLVVDESASQLIDFHSILKPYEFNTDLIDNSSKAIEAIRTKIYDIVFLDEIFIIGVTGNDLLKKIREMGNSDKYFRNLTIFGITDKKWAALTFLKEGCTDFIMKPVDIELLEAKLLKYLPKEKIKKLF